RRRHTISYGDWSPDVCSSDLQPPEAEQVGERVQDDGIGEGSSPLKVAVQPAARQDAEHTLDAPHGHRSDPDDRPQRGAVKEPLRSEERRVGEGGRVEGSRAAW